MFKIWLNIKYKDLLDGGLVFPRNLKLMPSQLAEVDVLRQWIRFHTPPRYAFISSMVSEKNSGIGSTGQVLRMFNTDVNKVFMAVAVRTGLIGSSSE